MRLDKFLKVSRLIKRRTLAKEVCDAGRVSVNGRVGKASTNVEEGDELRLDLGHRQIRVRVLAVPEHMAAGEAHTIYEVLE